MVFRAVRDPELNAAASRAAYKIRSFCAVRAVSFLFSRFGSAGSPYLLSGLFVRFIITRLSVVVKGKKVLYTSPGDSPSGGCRKRIAARFAGDLKSVVLCTRSASAD